MSRAPRRAEAEAQPESDAFEGAPHPRHARKLVGHLTAEAELLEAYRSGRLAHAWLIAGQEGVGKATLAWRFARFVLSHPDPGALAVGAAGDLGVAETQLAARQLEALAHPDFALVRRAWNGKAFYTEIRVDEVRGGMHIFQMSSAFGGWRVAIVDSADDLNRHSANALLKIIEEPPPKSLILIVAHRLGAVLPTIRSRCRRLLLEPLAPRAIVEVVESLGSPWSEAGADAIRDAAEQANGSVREALTLLEPSTQKLGALIGEAIAALPRGAPRHNLRLSELAAGRDGEAAYERLKLALLDWLAGEIRKPSSSARLETLADLWSLIRAQTREAEAINLDKRVALMALFEEFSARAGVLG